MLPQEKSKFTSIAKDDFFKKVLSKLSTEVELTNNEKTYILTTSILFYQQYEKDPRYLSFADLAYYIVLKYALTYKQYQPLFDFSVNFGFYPIAKSILDGDYLKEGKISDHFILARLEDFYKKGYIETLEQNFRSKSFLEDSSNEKCYLAPTSFGKSSIIIDYLKKSIDRNLKVAIIVPSKSLLMQTYRMIRKERFNSKILIHDEMYNNEEKFIAVFTQERALRLLKRSKIYYDILIIDEAHNLLKKDRNSNRFILLARLINRNRIINPNQKVVYLSPLINDVQNLRINQDQKITDHTIKFNIKEPDLFEYRIDKNIYLYNRFLNQFFKIESSIDLDKYIIEKSGKKNFLYQRSPRKIEVLAKKISETVATKTYENDEISTIVKNLENEVHKDFYAIEYVKKGVIYLHGKIPDLIKEYLEEKFSEIPEIKYIVANTVILEGINMPIDTLFIYNTYSLNGKDLINLIGRVNRLNTIFEKSIADFNKLNPKIHFINTGEYSNPHTKKIEQLRSRSFADVVKNPLLEEFDIKNLKLNGVRKEKEEEKINELISNEELLFKNPENNYEEIQKAFVEADILGYYESPRILINNFIIKQNLIQTNQKTDWNSMDVIEKINYLFIEDLILTDFEFGRLENIEARKYYRNYIYINRKKSFKERVNSQFDFFVERAKSTNPDDRLYYMGETYGNTYKFSEKYAETKKKVFVDLNEESDISKVNLSIVKLKIEDDFISFKLNKFIVLLFDFDLITKDEYHEIVYGTTDENIIALTKYGLNISLVNKLQKDNQIKNIDFDDFNNIIVNEEFRAYYNTLTDFQKFEIDRFV